MIRVLLVQPEPTYVSEMLGNAVINTAISVELSTNSERSKSLSDVVKLLAESPLSAIDNTRTGPLVTSTRAVCLIACMHVVTWLKASDFNVKNAQTSFLVYG